jgi:hypothetical protein
MNPKQSEGCLHIFSLRLCDNFASLRENYEHQHQKIPGNN